MALATVLPANAAGGLNGNISGTVLDQGGKPVPGASVTVASPSGFYKQQTDARGFFNFLTIPTDTYTISVEAKGFEPVSQSGITVPGDGTVELGSIKLQVSAQLKQIVQVRARSQSSVFQPSQTVPQFTVAGNILTAAQGKQASSSETDVLLAAPGFQIDKMGDLVLNGSTTDEIKFLFDGVDFTDPGFNRNGNNYFFNGISSTQIVSGAGDPSQGNSGVGTVNLVVKRGSYPGTGLLDAEALSRPFDHQINFQYGIATKNNAVSDYFSYFKQDESFQYGPWGSAALEDGVGYNAPAYTQTSDFVNNFVFRFGKNQNQSLQALYYSNASSFYDDYSGIAIPYDNQGGIDGTVSGGLQACSTGAEYCINGLGAYPALPANVLNSLVKPVLGQDPNTARVCCGVNNSASQPDSIAQTTLLKFEYDNQFNASTALALRYFNSNIYTFAFPVGGEENISEFPLSGQSSGGSRTGGIFELTKQADSRNLLTLSGNVELSRPNFASSFSPVGVEQLGPNAALFVRPADPNEPVSATNPCPISAATYPGACFLQQYYYTKGGTPYPPSLDLDSKNLQKFYGLGFRDQVQVNSNLRLDLGVRYDLLNEGFGNNLYYEDENVQPVPGSPSTYYVANYPNVEQPHFIEPRFGISDKLTSHDSVAFTYGKSINETGSGEQASPNNFDAYAPFSNIPISAALSSVWQTAGQPLNPQFSVTPSTCYPNIPFATGATATSQPSYAGKVGTTLQLGKPCSNLAQLLYFNGDAYYPEIAAVVPAVFENYDFNYSHLFKNGSALRIAPFFRQGKDIQVATAPLIFNPATGLYTSGSLVNQPGGKNTTTGVDLAYTLPDRKYGLNGFLSASYVNEFTNTPPAGDSPYGQDFEPYVLPQSYATGDLYRAGFVSPVTTNLGLSYTFKSGFRINPVLHFNIGYPYNAGDLTPYLSSVYGPQNVPNTNLTDQFGAPGAPSFVDPANPGLIGKPNISATRGEPETASGGGLLSRPQLTADLTLEYTPPGSRATFGFQIQDLFNNGYFLTPAVNGNYYPVTTGVTAPLTGQSASAAGVPGYFAPVVKNISPYTAYTVPYYQTGTVVTAPTNFRLYFQYAL